MSLGDVANYPRGWNLKRDRASADVRTIKKLDRDVYPFGYVRCKESKEVGGTRIDFPTGHKQLLTGGSNNDMEQGHAGSGWVILIK